MSICFIHLVIQKQPTTSSPSQKHNRRKVNIVSRHRASPTSPSAPSLH